MIEDLLDHSCISPVRHALEGMRKNDVIPGLLHVSQISQHFVAHKALTRSNNNRHAVVVLNLANTINTADAGNNNHVPPG